jgi:large subunit ribosomal protein L32e
MMPSGHKAFLVSNVKDVELLMMHNMIFAAEYVQWPRHREETGNDEGMRRGLRGSRWLTRRCRIAHNVSSRKRIDIIARAKQLGVKVTNPKAKVTTEV